MRYNMGCKRGFELTGPEQAHQRDMPNRAYNTRRFLDYKVVGQMTGGAQMNHP